MNIDMSPKKRQAPSNNKRRAPAPAPRKRICIVKTEGDGVYSDPELHRTPPPPEPRVPASSILITKTSTTASSNWNSIPSTTTSATPKPTPRLQPCTSTLPLNATLTSASPAVARGLDELLKKEFIQTPDGKTLEIHILSDGSDEQSISRKTASTKGSAACTTQQPTPKKAPQIKAPIVTHNESATLNADSIPSKNLNHETKDENKMIMTEVAIERTKAVPKTAVVCCTRDIPNSKVEGNDVSPVGDITTSASHADGQSPNPDPKDTVMIAAIGTLDLGNASLSNSTGTTSIQNFKQPRKPGGSSISKPKAPRKPRGPYKRAQGNSKAAAAAGLLGAGLLDPFSCTYTTSSATPSSAPNILCDIDRNISKSGIEEICPGGDVILNICHCTGSTLTKIIELGNRISTEVQGSTVSNGDIRDNSVNIVGDNNSALDQRTNSAPIATPPPPSTPAPKESTLSAPPLRFKVSSTILSLASPSVFKNLLSHPPLGTIASPLVALVEICPLQVYGFRASLTELTLIINTDRSLSPSLDLAFETLLNILHFRTADLHRPPVLPSTTAQIIELAWMFGCVETVLPWLQVWISGYKKRGKWPDFDPEYGVKALDLIVSRVQETKQNSGSAAVWMIMSWIMGDEKAFEQSSRDFLFAEFVPRNLFGKDNGQMGNLHTDKPFGVEAHVYENLCSRRQEFISQIYNILNDFFSETCSKATTDQLGLLVPGQDHIALLGSLVQSVMSIWGTNFPLKPTKCDLTIFSLWEKTETLVRNLEAVSSAQGKSKTLESKISHPVMKLGKRLDDVWVGLKGLQLKDYRQDSTHLMDFYTGFLV